MTLPPPPKFVKSSHHVVPVLWQRRFAAGGEPGPYYLNVQTGKALKAQGPGDKMAEEYVNIVFDEFYRPSDLLEDQLSRIETSVARGLDRLIQAGEIDDDARVDIAMLLAIQACRYPDRFASRLDLAKYLAIALAQHQNKPDVASLNSALQASGMLPGASLTAADFTRLKSAPEEQIEGELNDILSLHGYEAHFNPSLIWSAALPLASHLLALEWNLLHASQPAFAISDRPVPYKLEYGFSLGLSACFGLVISRPDAPVAAGTIYARTASQSEIDEVNAEVRSRAREWICGPGPWVHKL